MRRGMLPAYHQMFYQLCDLHDDQLQSIINDPRWLREKANMKTGFYDAEMFRMLRDALTQMIKETVLKLDDKDGNGSKKSEPSTSTDGTGSMKGEQDEEVVDNFGEDDDEEGDGDVDGDQKESGGAAKPKDGGDDSESENEMEMEMLEFMNTAMEPS